MKKLLLFTTQKYEMLKFRDMLEEYFHGTIEVEALCRETAEPGRSYEAEVLLTYADLISELDRYQIRCSKMVPLTVTLSRGSRDAIMNIPQNQRVILLEPDLLCARRIAHLIKELFRGDLQIEPYTSAHNGQVCQTAIAYCGDNWLPPGLKIENIIFVDYKVIDRTTFLEVASSLGLDENVYKGKNLKYARKTIPAKNSFDSVFKENAKMEKRMFMLFENMTDGAITCCRHGIIFDFSAKVQEILNLRREELLEFNVTKLLPVTLEELVGTGASEKIVEINNNDYILTIIPASGADEEYGLLLLRSFDSEQRRINMHRKTIIRKRSSAKYDLTDLTGGTPVMEACRQTAMQIAKSNATALILGESGTGKELFAHIIHRHSQRAQEQFVAVNCAAFSESLLESELFGYEDGAFTGAAKGGKPGLFEAAHRGTVFLDEIGEMPLHLQTRLLRVLQEKEVTRVGGYNTMNVDLRVIAATNQDLPQAIAEGRFRRDLYYRLNVLPLYVPPLRARKQDIQELFHVFMDQKQASFRFSPELWEFFHRYEWPGNVRELKNLVELFSVLGKAVITLEDLPWGFNSGHAGNSGLRDTLPQGAGLRDNPSQGAGLRDSLPQGAEFRDSPSQGAGLRDSLPQGAELHGNPFQGAGLRDSLPQGAGLCDGFSLRLEAAALSILRDCYRQALRIGRKELARRMSEQGFFMGEQQARNLLKQLEAKGLVTIAKGRGGTVLTERGWRL